ncbi:MAG: site-specific integrase [Planctomycetia bacterium]|nr:site-specific integrase [Planctomycetia bacterium]
MNMAAGENLDNPAITVNSTACSWSNRFGEKHRWRRLVDLPAGFALPKKIRIYQRANHYLLQWWEPSAKRNLTERINSDLLAALTRARELDDRLLNVKATGAAKKRVTHIEMVDCFQKDLERRANAGELAFSTPARYRSALRYYLQFCELPESARTFPFPVSVNREFRMAFVEYIIRLRLDVRGSSETGFTGCSPHYLLDVARAMYLWAADPELGHLLPENFHNPFLRAHTGLARLVKDPLAPPDITTLMACDFLRECNLQQLRLFVPIVLFGLRASEPCFLFHEHVVGDWLRVPNLPELAYQTKGKREKRFPLVPELATFWLLLHGPSQEGLLFIKPTHKWECIESSNSSIALQTVVQQFVTKMKKAGDSRAATQLGIRTEVFRAAGGIDYDFIEDEFKKIARRLNWPRRATLKDFRHLFCTTLNNSGMPEVYRRYLMGHALGKGAILNYTHLDELQRHYRKALLSEWGTLLETIEKLAISFSTDVTSNEVRLAG